MALKPEEKAEMIGRLIANEGLDTPGPWNEDDELALNALPEEKLIALDRQRELAVMNAEQEPVVNGKGATANKGKFPFSKKKKDDMEDMMDDEEDEEPAENEEQPPPIRRKKEPVANKAKKDLAQHLSSLPTPVRNVINSALRFQQKQREKLVERIVANERNTFNEEFLSNEELCPMEMLEGIADLASNEDEEEAEGSRVLNYGGQRGGTTTPVVNESFAKEDLDMVLEN